MKYKTREHIRQAFHTLSNLNPFIVNNKHDQVYNLIMEFSKDPSKIDREIDVIFDFSGTVIKDNQGQFIEKRLTNISNILERFESDYKISLIKC
jgi:hypothetical protein